jgi:hypothetical protein
VSVLVRADLHIEQPTSNGRGSFNKDIRRDLLQSGICEISFFRHKPSSTKPRLSRALSGC